VFEWNSATREFNRKSAQSDRRWREQTTQENWIICEITNSPIHCCDRVRIGRVMASDLPLTVDQNVAKKWELRDSRGRDRSEKRKRSSLFGIKAIDRFQLCHENDSGRLRRVDIGETGKHLTADDRGEDIWRIVG
jgi:hypothetical protein